ncbi:MAG: excisionase family DNA-binding protein [Lachnospiraceae bacterium]|nr:excisionase family DNA-binding protein [Lachnospiraceae bacterium]
MKHSQNVPLWEKYTLTVEEAAAYFRIGEHKLRRHINENKNADYLLWNGNRVQIKREKFEKFVDTLEAI